jgi:hypothetical protein
MATELDVPPGLDDVKAHVYAQGGNEHEWRPFNHTRLYTNAFVIEGNKVCLCALSASAAISRSLDCAPNSSI